MDFRVPSVLEIPAGGNNTEAVNALLDSALQPEKDLAEALSVAIGQNNTEMVKIIATAGASVNDTNRSSILRPAIEYDRVDIVQYLIELTQDDRVSFVNTLGKRFNVNRESGLWVAVMLGHVDIVRSLVEAGADPGLQCTISGGKYLSIHVASRHSDCNSCEIIRYLIGIKSDQLEAKTSRGETCLH
ncbi:ankyrin repeat-containing domain protein [Xylaria cf. heliscus]|nr:ankyrin repeat-containing domain protein [Xylaria cf. heliscus]